MPDFSRERDAMVDSQIHTADVTDRRLLKALRTLPRHKFMPKSKAAIAYADCEVEAAAGRWMLRPRDLGLLIHAAHVQPDELVLNIASGRGYAAAVLSRMAETVVCVEADATLVKKSSDAARRCRMRQCRCAERRSAQGRAGAGSLRCDLRRRCS